MVTIRSGAGGVDAADFAQMLLRMYLRYCERNGFKAKVIGHLLRRRGRHQVRHLPGGRPYAYGRLSVEGGTHRLVRISPFDNQGRRQTSFAAVGSGAAGRGHRSHRHSGYGHPAWTPTAPPAPAARA